MTTVAVQMVVPLHCQPSSTCSPKDDDGGGGANDGVSASLAVSPSLAKPIFYWQELEGGRKFSLTCHIMDRT
jgi:hypothetical protein